MFKRKRYIALLIVFILLFTSVPVFEVFAYPDTEQEFYQYLISTNQSLKSNDNKPVNFNIYRNYGVVVYGNPWGDCEWSPTTNKDEYRYLGYTLDDSPYTNTRFPNDARGTKTPLQWTYTTVSNASDSWDNVRDSELRSFMQNSNLSFEGVTYSGLKVVSSLIGINKAKLLNSASFKNGFSVYTRHYGADGKLYYATLTGPPMAGSNALSCTLSTPSNTYTIKPDQDSITVPVTVTGNVALSGYAKTSHIENIKVAFEDSDKSGTAVSNLSLTSDKVITRQALGVGTHTVTLKGGSTMKTVFNDDYNATSTKTITVNVLDPDKPMLINTPAAEPNSIQFDNNDVAVEVTVNGELLNYENVDNIKDWSVYAKKKEDTTAQQVIGAAGVTASGTFNFTIPKEKLNGVNNYTQEYITTVTVRFKSPIYDPKTGNSVTYLSETKNCLTQVYKTAPIPPVPPTTGLPPVSVISARSEVKAGDYIRLDGSKSHDPDGTIDSYDWITDGAQGFLGNVPFGNVWYEFSGEKDISLTVVDNDGNTDTDYHTIKVTEPTCEIMLDVFGSFKENRKFTVDISKSTSPIKYPIDWTRSNISIQPLSGGTVSDIKYFGSLSGVQTKDILIKKAGTYHISANIINTRGYTSSASRTITIVPDQDPVADFFTETKVLRNPQDGSKALIQLNDISYSPDSDTIGSRLWQFKYDKDNDGDFTDEVWTTIDSGNNLSPSFKVYEVGKYLISLTVEEVFGQPTIPEFVTAADIRIDNTDSKIIDERIVEVINTAPVIDFEMKKKKPLDLVIVTDYVGAKLSALQSQITVMETNLRSLNIDTKVSLITNKVPVASQTAKKFNYYRNLHLPVTVNSGTGSDMWMHPWPYYMDCTSRWETVTSYEVPAPEVPIGRHYSWGGYSSSYVSPSGNTKSIIYKGYDTTGGSTDVEFTYYYHDPYSGYTYHWTSYSIGNLTLDSTFTKAEHVGTDTFTVYNMDVEGIRNIALRDGSDRFLMMLSDGKGKDYSKAYGDNFTLGNLTQSLKDYTKSKNMKVYSVLDIKSLYSTLVNETIVDVEATKSMQMQRTASGDVWLRLNDGRTYKIDESILGKVKRIFEGNLVLFDNGTVKFFDGITLKPFPVSNIIAASGIGGGSVVATSNTVYVVDSGTGAIIYTYGGFSDITNVKRDDSVWNYSNIYVFTSTYTYKIVDTNGDQVLDTCKYIFPSYPALKDTTAMHPYASVPVFYGLTTSGQLIKNEYPEAHVLVASNVKDMKHSWCTNDYYARNGLGSSYKFAALMNDGSLMVDYPVVTGKVKERDGDDVYYITTYGNRRLVVLSSTVKFNSIASIGRNIYALGNDGNLYEISWDNGTTSLRIVNSNIVSMDDIYNTLVCNQTDGTILIKQFYGNYYQDTFNYNVKKVNGVEYSPLILYKDGKTNTSVLPNNITLSNPSATYISACDFISGSPDNKTFSVGQYAQALTDIGNSYKADPSFASNYVLLNDEVDLTLFYNDYELDPELTRQWTFTHNDKYFDNSLGVHPQANKPILAPILKFDKVGKFDIVVKARDNPLSKPGFDNYRLWSKGDNNLTLYVHRKPVALFTISIAPNGSLWRIEATDSGSYDLDHMSRADKGIAATEWGWKEEYESTWRNERFNKADCDSTKKYFVRYRVRDLEGAWSDYNYLEISSNAPPIANFTIDNNPLKFTDKAKIKDKSFGIFSNLTGWRWVVRDNDTGTILQDQTYANRNMGTGTLAGYDVNVKTDYAANGIGDYDITLYVRNDKNVWSVPYTQTLNVITPNVPPAVSLSHTPSFVYEGDDVGIRILPTDPDNDPLDIVLEESRDNVNWVQVYSVNDSPAGSTRTFTKNDIGLGRYYYRVTVTDPYGEIATDSLDFTTSGLSISGQVNHTLMWNEHRIDYNQSKTGTDNSPRAYTVFFPGEKFMVHAETTAINPSSTVFASDVDVAILGTGFSDVLDNTGATSWDGSVWDAIMERWGGQNITFRFTVVYSNGAVKTDDVTISIGDDTYWRLHRKD